MVVIGFVVLTLHPIADAYELCMVQHSDLTPAENHETTKDVCLECLLASSPCTEFLSGESLTALKSGKQINSSYSHYIEYNSDFDFFLRAPPSNL